MLYCRCGTDKEGYMDSSEIREYLKRQVASTPGASQEQRERFYILELVYGLHKKINRLEKCFPVIPETKRDR